MIRKRFQYIFILHNKPKRAAKRALSAVRGYLQAGLTAALDFEAIKPRIFNAVAVGEMHHITAPARLITKSRSHRAAKSAEKFAKNKDCFVQMQSLFAFYESLLRARAITYFGYAEILAPTAVFCSVFQNPE